MKKKRISDIVNIIEKLLPNESSNFTDEIKENVKKDTVSEDYHRSLKSNREKWLEKYGKHLHPQSNKNIASKY